MAYTIAPHIPTGLFKGVRKETLLEVEMNRKILPGTTRYWASIVLKLNPFFRMIGRKVPNPILEPKEVSGWESLGV